MFTKEDLDTSLIPASFCNYGLITLACVSTGILTSGALHEHGCNFLQLLSVGAGALLLWLSVV
jgi:hypothetical protein